MRAECVSPTRRTKRLVLQGAAIAVGAMLASPLAQPARADEPRMRLVVRLDAEVDEVLLGRIRGQLSDLPVHVAGTRLSVAGLSLAEQQQRMQDLTSAHDADAGLWFAVREDPARLFVFVSRPDHEPIAVGRLEGASRPLDSVELETAALIVRGVAQALLSGEEPQALEPTPGALDAGDTDDRGSGAAPAPSPEPVQTMSPPTTQQSPGGAPPKDEVSSYGAKPDDLPPLELAALLGWRGMHDGAGAGISHGALLHATLAIGAFELGAAGVLSAPHAIGTEVSEVRIARHEAMGSLALGLEHGTMRWALGGRAGVHVLHRSSEARDERRFEPRAAHTTYAFAVGPFVRLAWMPGAVGLALQAGLDVLPDPPHFEQRIASTTTETLYRPAMFNPRVALGVQARLP